MAAEIRPVAQVRPAPGPVRQTADQAYWQTFKNQLLLPSPHNAGVTSITIPEANPSGPPADTFAVTSGSRIQTYSVKTRKLVKTISRFGVDDTARSGVLRRDGRILLAGGDSGVIQAFDTGSRAILRQWRDEHAHKQPVHTVRWSPTVLTDLMSCSDDRTVRAWDLTEDAPVWTGIGHEDYVRSGAYLPGQGGKIIVSGSYDQTVRIWDTRMDGNAATTLKFPALIEDVMPLNSSTLAAASGNEVFVMDLIAGKPEHVIRSHQKTVITLGTGQHGSRILTGALDGHVKVHNTTNWEVVAAFKYPAPVLSLAVVPSPAGAELERDDRHLAVGLQTGLLSIRTRLAGTEKVRAREREKKMQALVAGEGDEYERRQKKKDMRQGIRARDRGKDFKGESADIVITGNERTRRKELQPWQKRLREAKYNDALDLVVSPPGGKPFQRDDFFTLVTALRHRSALRTALADRSPEKVTPILNLINQYISYPQHTYLLYDMMLLILDLYSHRLDEWQNDNGDGKDAVQQIMKIRQRVRTASDWADMAQRTLGMVSMLETG